MMSFILSFWPALTGSRAAAAADAQGKPLAGPVRVSWGGILLDRDDGGTCPSEVDCGTAGMAADGKAADGLLSVFFA